MSTMSSSTMPGTAPPLATDARKQPVAFLLLLTGLAGFMDAVGFVQLGHLYLSFMSGNSTHLGLVLAEGRWWQAAWVALFICAFVVGAALGTWIGKATASGQIPAVLIAELALFLLALGIAALGYGSAGLLAVVVAMGMQNTLHRVVAGTDIGRSFVTGMLFNLGEAIALSLHDRSAFAKALRNLQSWCGFVFGVVLGALALAAFGLSVSLGIAATALVCLIGLGLRVDRPA